MSTASKNDDGFIAVVILVMVVLFGTVLWECVSLGIQSGRENATIPEAMPAILGATQVNPEEARKILAPVWQDIQAVSPMTVTATEGGSSLRWSRVGTDGCEKLRAFLTQNAANAANITVIQNGAILDPGSYADLSCSGPGGHTMNYAFTFKPRTGG